MKRCLANTVYLLLVIGAMSGLLALVNPEAVAQKGKDKGKGKGGKGFEDPALRATRDLNQAYKTIAHMAWYLDSGGVRLPRELTKLPDHARDFYRQASRAYKNNDLESAAELAKAANDAARGVKHVLESTFAAPKDLPEPPEDRSILAGVVRVGKKGKDKEGVAGALQGLYKASEKIREFDAVAGRGVGRDFHDAARDTYAKARQAYLTGDYLKAADLARAADAWAHVADHLARANIGVAGGPRLLDRGAGNRNAPPPPPPLK